MSEPLTAVKPQLKIPFKNAHSQSVPPFGVMQVVGTAIEDGVAFLVCSQVGTTLGTEFAINGPVTVAPGSKGVCYRHGDVRAAFDTATPLAGDHWGVRANQWTLSKGYPAILVAHGIRDAAARVLHGGLRPLVSVMGTPQADLPPVSGGQPGYGLVTVYVWDGTSFVPSTPAMQFLAHNVSTSTLRAGSLVPFVLANGVWVAGGAEQLVRFELTSDLNLSVDPTGDNARIVVYSSFTYAATGPAITVYDWTIVAGENGAWSGKAGARGWARKSTDSNRYEIVWMERRARFICFRLYERLTTGSESQGNCAVLSYWDGINPDPNQLGVTVFNLPTDVGSVFKFFGEANAVGYATWDERLEQYSIVALEGDGRHWVLFKNNSGYTIPACGVVTDLGITTENGGHTNARSIMTVGRPSTTLSQSYWVNGYVEVGAGGVGVCSSTDGPCEALYESGSPSNGETWGPKPGQFTLAKGYPGFSVLGVTDSFVKLVLVRPQPIDQLLVKTTAHVGNNATTSDYKVYVSDAGSELDSGFVGPAAYNRSGWIANGTWAFLIRANTHWELIPRPETMFLAKLAAALSPGSSASATIWSGSPGAESSTGVTVTVYDWLMKSGASPIASGKKLICRYVNGTAYVVDAECP